MYILTNDPSGTVDTIFTQSTTKISVFTSDNTKVAIYPLLLTATIAGGPSSSASLVLTITDSCALASITTTTFTAAITYDVSYNPATTIINLDWTVAPSYCPTLTYYLY